MLNVAAPSLPVVTAPSVSPLVQYRVVATEVGHGWGVLSCPGGVSATLAPTIGAPLALVTTSTITVAVSASSVGLTTKSKPALWVNSTFC